MGSRLLAAGQHEQAGRAEEHLGLGQALIRASCTSECLRGHFRGKQDTQSSAKPSTGTGQAPAHTCI